MAISFKNQIKHGEDKEKNDSPWAGMQQSNMIENWPIQEVGQPPRHRMARHVEVVVDLGSGAGIDCFIAAKQAVSLDMFWVFMGWPIILLCYVYIYIYVLYYIYTHTHIHKYMYVCLFIYLFIHDLYNQHLSTYIYISIHASK